MSDIRVLGSLVLVIITLLWAMVCHGWLNLQWFCWPMGSLWMTWGFICLAMSKDDGP